MDSEQVPKIAVAASNGWVFRNLLETDLFLTTDLIEQVVFFVDQQVAKGGVRLLEEKFVQYEIVEFQYSKPLLWLKSFLLYIEVFHNAPNYSANKFRTPAKFIWFNLFKMFRVLRLMRPIHKLARLVLERRLEREASTLMLPKFDIFLSASPNAVQDNLIAIRSRQAGRPVANLILSWDNIYSKGYMAPADLYVVWGEVMAKQLATLFDVPSTQIVVLGAPHIGGLKPQNGFVYPRDTLLYSTTTKVHFPDEKELVARLAQDFSADVFPCFKRLLIRTHPAGPNNIYNDLAAPDVGIFVEHPTSFEKCSISNWVPDNNELAHLGKQLSRVSVAVNMASTMSLDCLTHGIHVINVTKALNGRDLMRYYRSEHYASLLDLNLVHLAGFYVELVEAIQNAPKTPDPAIAERIQSFIRPTDATALESFRANLLRSINARVMTPIKPVIQRG